MKRLIFAFLMILATSVQATNYYISNAGNDANSGTSEGQPWQTLAKVNSSVFAPGDQLLFHRGHTFAGSLTITNSGSAGNPIVLSAYSTGAAPIITGFTSVTSWTNTGANIWESSAAVTSLASINMLTISGQPKAMGRYPNSNETNGGYLTFESHTSNTSITDNQLTDAVNWTGAEVVVRPNRWILDRRTITSHTSGTLTFSALSYVPADGFGYFIQADPRTLDQSGEWYFNPTTKKLKIYSVAEPSAVQVATTASLLTINASYITVENIVLQGANSDLITGNGTLRSNIIIRNCELYFAGSNFISGINAENYTIQNNICAYSNNNGISGGTGDHVSILENTISSVGLFPGMSTLIYHAISTAENSNVRISQNIIDNIGNNGISFYSDSATIEKNYIRRFNQVLDDGGGVYTYTGNRTTMTGDTIRKNIIVDGIGAVAGSAGNMTTTSVGIYLDANSKNIFISENTVANIATYGLLMNNPNSITVQANTFFNCSPAIRSSRFSGSQAVTGNSITGNLLIAKTATQQMIYLISTEEDLAAFGTIDQNRYCRPLDDSGGLFLTSQPSATYVTRTFAQWKTYSGHDAASAQSPKTLESENYLSLGFNETATAKTVSFAFPGIDATGARYASSVLLQPYQSLVIFRDLTNISGTLRPLKTPGGNVLKTSTGVILSTQNP